MVPGMVVEELREGVSEVEGVGGGGMRVESGGREGGEGVGEQWEGGGREVEGERGVW